jgi:DNA-binding transcriptional MerR regulator
VKEELTLADLAESSGLPARTIRFYIASALLDGPVKSGRAAAYTSEHLARLEKIKELQAKGRMLSEIGRSLAGATPEKSAAPPTAWWQHAITDDVVIMTRADASPWRTKQIRAAIEEFTRSLEPVSDEKRSRK